MQQLMSSRGIHVMCIAETRLDKTVVDGELAIPIFPLHRRDRQHGRGGGVASYCHESLSVLRKHDLECTDREIIWLKLNDRKRKHLIGCHYPPPLAPSVTWDRLEECIQGAVGDHNELVLVSDFNVNMLGPQNFIRNYKSISMKYAVNFWLPHRHCHGAPPFSNHKHHLHADYPVPFSE